MLRRVEDLALGFVGLSFLLIGLTQAVLAKSVGVPLLLMGVGALVLSATGRRT